MQGAADAGTGDHSPPSRIRRPEPRAGVVNARRPGHGPGRSNAKSIDHTEHGVSIVGAMVVRSCRWSDTTHVSRARVVRTRVVHGAMARALFWARRWSRISACNRRESPARNVTPTQETRGEDTRWRERPRPGALGSGAGPHTGVVHAIVSVVTAGPPWFEEAAPSAA